MSSLLSACTAGGAPGTVSDEVPVWFMRQAGRSLPEYRALRAGTNMLESCFEPDLVTEITMQPVRRHGVDAAVFFSDIMVPLKAAGVDLDIVAGRGPVVASPVRTRADVEAIPALDPEALLPVTTAVTRLVAELGPTPLIGFCGAPFTLASYLVEGAPSKDYAHTKSLMVGDPGLWAELMRRLSAISATFLRAQVDAGARVVQVFDSWVGSLSRPDYDRFVAPHTAAVLAEVSDVPRIHFGVGTGELLASMSATGADVMGVDWRIGLDEAIERLDRPKPLQGNLDPAILGAPWEVVAERVRDVIRRGAAAPGHVFNLGHGVPPSTDPDVLTRVVALVHDEGPSLRREALARRGE